MAHICGNRPDANRHDPSQTDNERNDYTNLILLCPTHHSLIDQKENENVYTIDILQQIKTAHEAKVLERLDIADVSDKTELAREISILLEENRQSWAQYGPMSELARQQPHNEAAHAVWMAERLSVIVPNNRKIAAILEDNRRAFSPDEQRAIAVFLIHARSYEQWVEDAIPYSAVKRFPAEFDEMIRRIANGGT